MGKDYAGSSSQIISIYVYLKGFTVKFYSPRENKERNKKALEQKKSTLLVPERIFFKSKKAFNYLHSRISGFAFYCKLTAKEVQNSRSGLYKPNISISFRAFEPLFSKTHN